MKPDFTPYPLRFKPIMKERIWGGRMLPALFGLQTDRPIGEVWTLSDHPSDPSICVNGPLQGKSLSEIIREYPEIYLGTSWSARYKELSGMRFPLLIKFLHAEDDLSVQIHPDDEYALKHENDFGKTEAWYILAAEEEAKIVYGHSFSTREEYFGAIKEKTVPRFLKYLRVRKGDFVFVPAKTLHALLKGTMVIEIQQTSDVTYRVHDWDRVDAEGKSRELHIDKAADVLRYGEGEELRTPAPQIISQSEGMTHLRLIECPYFMIEKVELNSPTKETGVIPFSVERNDNPDIVIVIEGEGELRYEGETISLREGDTILIPRNMKRYEVTGRLSFLRTSY